MEIKIATWNMAYWSHKNLLEKAWNYFLNEIPADIFFFQESRPSEEIKGDKKHLIWNEIGGKRNWGSGIYSPKYELLEEIIETQFKGVFSVGNTQINGQTLTLISLYGLMENSGPTKGYSIPNLHRMISDLTGLFNGHIRGKRKIIMCGDLNASTQLDMIQKNNSHKILFDRIEDFGLKDVYKLSGNKNYVQTLRHTRSQRPWQNDYLFISEFFSKNLIDYKIVDNDLVRKYSDHNPVIITLDL